MAHNSFYDKCIKCPTFILHRLFTRLTSESISGPTTKDHEKFVITHIGQQGIYFVAVQIICRIYFTSKANGYSYCCILMKFFACLFSFKVSDFATGDIVVLLFLFVCHFETANGYFRTFYALVLLSRILSLHLEQFSP